MLNKELLLITNPKKELGYTHTITIGTDGDFFVGYDAEAGYGGVEPEFFLGEGLIRVRSYCEFSRSEVQILGFLGVTQLYLGRVDTEKVVKLDYVDEADGVAYGVGDFITLDDVDTIIPIWIGENPPPWA